MAVSSIIATCVDPKSRLAALPRHFGTRLMLAVERGVFQALGRLSCDYCGGHWHFYELSNGGFYMAPDTGPVQVRVPGSGFSEILSADAAGIVACLFAYGRLAAEHSSDVLVNHYYWLRDFGRLHAEALKIFRAID